MTLGDQVAAATADIRHRNALLRSEITLVRAGEDGLLGIEPAS